MVPALTAQDIELWTVYIKNICGNSHDASKAYLIETRLAPLLQETGSVSWIQLFSKVKNDPTGTLRKKVINLITTNETSFFRDTTPFELLQYKIIPDLIDFKRKQNSGAVIPIRIWSAACSTGQEVYSTSIVFKELLGDLNKYDIRILGTDISDKVMAAASYAKYSKMELERGLTQGKISKYFTQDGSMWKIRDEIRAMATFRTMNLLEPFVFPYKFDIILCRNVAIYFSIEDRKNLFGKIANVLAPNGYLIVGSTESLTGICPQFESKRYLQTVFYQPVEK
ncbi:MAG: protein-glutamate O-methyltransferase CheR [Fibrobacter sp.]|nr:protein-glutamate O-methyltransferase CheR [Fibrobacter sp.]